MICCVVDVVPWSVADCSPMSKGMGMAAIGIASLGWAAAGEMAATLLFGTVVWACGAYV